MAGTRVLPRSAASRPSTPGRSLTDGPNLDGGAQPCGRRPGSVIAEAHLLSEQTAKRYMKASDQMARATLAATLSGAFAASAVLLIAASIRTVTVTQSLSAARVVAALSLLGILAQGATRTYRLWRQHRAVKEYLTTVTLEHAPPQDLRHAVMMTAPPGRSAARTRAGPAGVLALVRDVPARLGGATLMAADRLLIPDHRAARHLRRLLQNFDAGVVEVAWRQSYWQQDSAALLELLSQCDHTQAAALCRLAEASMCVPSSGANCQGGSCEWPAGCRASALLRQAVSRNLGADAAELATTLIGAWSGPQHDLTLLLDAAENAHA